MSGRTVNPCGFPVLSHRLGFILQSQIIKHKNSKLWGNYPLQLEKMIATSKFLSSRQKPHLTKPHYHALNELLFHLTLVFSPPYKDDFQALDPVFSNQPFHQCCARAVVHKTASFIV